MAEQGYPLGVSAIPSLHSHPQGGPAGRERAWLTLAAPGWYNRIWLPAGPLCHRERRERIQDVAPEGRVNGRRHRKLGPGDSKGTHQENERQSRFKGMDRESRAKKEEQRPG